MNEPQDPGYLPAQRRSSFEIVASDGAPPPRATRDEEGLDVRRFLHLFWRKKWWIVLATALGVAAGWFLAQRTAATYETRATVWVESRDRSSGPIQAPEVLEGQGWSDLLVSRAVLEPVVVEEKLFLRVPGEEGVRSRLFSGFSVADSVREGLYRFSVDSASGWVLEDATADTAIARGALGDSVGKALGFEWAPAPGEIAPDEEVRFRVMSPPQAAQRLRSNITVLFDPRSGNLITARLTWHDPRQAARILNAALESFLDVAKDLKTQKLREKVEILEQQTEYAANRLDSAELALEQRRVQNITQPTDPRAHPIPGGQGTRDPVFQAYFERKLQADELESQISQLRDALGQLRGDGEVDVTGLQMIPAVSQSSPLSRTLSTLVEKSAERRSLLLTYTEQHPSVRGLTQQIEALKTETLPSQISSLIEQLRSRLNNLQGEIEAQTSELRQIPPRTIAEERLRRDMEMAEKLHNDLLVRLKEAELAASTSLPDLQIVDRATPPGSPMSHEGPRIFLMASMAGLGLGLGGVLLFDRFDRRFRYPDQVTDGLGLPVLGVIPRIRGGRPSSAEDAESVIEAFRAVRTQLTRLRHGSPTVIMVTSPSPRDGKSLVAANLAISFASSNRNTLLVDGDVRRGNAERMFDLPGEPGLTETLTNGTGVPDVLRTTDVPGLFLLPHGKLGGFDPVLLEDEKMDRVIQELRDRFSVIVVDAPPLVAGTDPLLLGERADQVLMVLRTGETDLELTRTRLESLGGFDFPLVGAVLNDVPDTAPYYKYHSSYRYYLEGEVVS